jgi:hypothetical protein
MESYQIRHKDYGIYQGNAGENPLWYPLHNMPKYGIIHYFDKKYAQDEIEILAMLMGCEVDDLILEPYNIEVDKGLRIMMSGKQNIIC